MKTLANLVWFAGAAALAFAQNNPNSGRGMRASPDPLPAADIAAIRSANEAYRRTCLSQAWSDWANLFTSDAIMMPPNGAAVTGRPAIEAWGRGFPPLKQFENPITEFDGAGEFALVRGTFSFVIAQSGQREQGKYLVTLRKGRDGAWKFSRCIFNSDLPLIAASGSPSATDPWLGTWKLNLAKTRINPGPAPRSQTRTYNATADGEKATYDMIEADGKRLYQEAVYRLDGQHVPLVGNPHADTQALRRTGPRSLAGETKRDGKVLHTARREVSEDGKVLTVEFKGTNRKGQPIIEEVWVFDRQTTGTAAEDVIAAVKAAAEKHMAAINTGDRQTIRNQHTPDFTLIQADTNERLNLGAVRSPVALAMAKRWEGAKPNWAIRDLHIQPYGNVAVATFYQDGTMRWGDGVIDTRTRQVTEVWVNENGTWKEAHHHDSVYTPNTKPAAAQ